MPSRREDSPVGWRWVRLGDLASDEQAFADGPFGSNLKTEHYVSGGARVVRLQNIGRGTFLDADKAFISMDHYASLQRHGVRQGDIVVAALGDGARPAGRACMIPKGLGPGLVKADCFRVRLPQGAIEADYLLAYLNSPDHLERMSEMMRGATRPRLTLGILRNTPVPIPPLPEQRRIVVLLKEQMAAVEQARAAAEARLEAAKALPAAYLRAMFVAVGVKGLARRRLGEVSEIVGGIQKSPERAPVKFHRPYLTVRNVQRGYLDLSRVERFEVTPQEVSRLRLVHGDILIVEGNGSLDHIGRNALFNGDGQEWVHQNHVIRVRLATDICLPEFVSSFLNSEQGRSQMIEKAKTTSGLYTLSAGKVAALEIPIPPLVEQERLMNELRDERTGAERARSAAEAELAAINALPAALLRRAFSGAL